MYEDRDNVHMDTTITYEDGRLVHIKTDLHILEIPVEEEKT